MLPKTPRPHGCGSSLAGQIYSCSLWHENLFKEPKPTGSRPSVLIGLLEVLPDNIGDVIVTEDEQQLVGDLAGRQPVQG